MIWIQTFLHSGGIPERIFLKKLILKKISRRQKKHEKLPRMQRVNAGKIFDLISALCTFLEILNQFLKKWVDPDQMASIFMFLYH